ncbi:hypothetical protein RRG08_029869 [Elysia crispata]|uniref:Uncharacterized protein n=1 Tax=Elysia crispata TaxID=231223 RepID=A0AAE0YKI8_9GAST|nr:hypothetical protein RRG08_029869 [Elysia crispata]
MAKAFIFGHINHSSPSFISSTGAPKHDDDDEDEDEVAVACMNFRKYGHKSCSQKLQNRTSNITKPTTIATTCWLLKKNQSRQGKHCKNNNDMF